MEMRVGHQQTMVLITALDQVVVQGLLVVRVVKPQHLSQE
jgi:hypothetical protein